MIKVTGRGPPSAAAGTRRLQGQGGGAFQIDAGAKPATGANAVSGAAPAQTLSALIALQMSSRRDAGRRSSIVAAQRALALLDQLRVGLLEGTFADTDLDALALAAAAKGGPDVVEPALEAVLNEIALRARVELAKRGR